MTTTAHTFVFAGLLAAALLGLAGCASGRSQGNPARQPPLSPPPQLGTLDTQPGPGSMSSQQSPPEAVPAQPTLPDQQPSAAGVKAEVKRSAGQIRPDVGQGFLPGVKQQRAAKGDPNAALPFEQRLKERQKRINLGLDQPEQKSAPVSNVLDSGF